MNGAERCLYRSIVMVLSLLVLPLSARADELMKWERIPLPVTLMAGQERVIFADKNVRVGFPPALNGKLRVQSTGGAVYLKAESVFPQTRLQLQDVESGEIILLDVTAAEKGPTEPVRIVYEGSVSTVSQAGTAASARSAEHKKVVPGGDDGSQALRQPVKYAEPLPVLLTRYAAQSLYAPLRTLEAVPGIRPVNTHLPGKITTLYPSEPLTVTPLAAWAAGGRAVVALKLTSTVSRKIILDPRALQGKFIAATFQHRWLGAAGTPEDTTTLYVVTAERPEQAFIAEPASHRIPSRGEVKHAD
ncbi:TIGR03749 family integrating conjugative element protein [Escherichia coli]|uniref:TIGR03749 family integrating conjugative element protein n=2 Tax=Escherichia coli TaxID=562 RepID=UPI00132EC020|nr:TIGR03749 family integrating conjugative element protein [Escherichia coli]